MTKKCMIIGYLPEEEENHPKCIKMREKIREEILKQIEDGCDSFYTGVEMGVEMWSAEIILKLKDEHNLTLISVLADENRADDWSEEHRERYFDYILPNSDTVVYSEYGRTSDSIMKRDKIMLQRSDVVIAIFDSRLQEMQLSHSIQSAKTLKKKINTIDTSTL